MVNLLKLATAFYKNVKLATYDDSSYGRTSEILKNLNFCNKSDDQIDFEDKQLKNKLYDSLDFSELEDKIISDNLSVDDKQIIVNDLLNNTGLRNADWAISCLDSLGINLDKFKDLILKNDIDNSDVYRILSKKISLFLQRNISYLDRMITINDIKSINHHFMTSKMVNTIIESSSIKEVLHAIDLKNFNKFILNNKTMLFLISKDNEQEKLPTMLSRYLISINNLALSEKANVLVGKIKTEAPQIYEKLRELISKY
jgi:hypothetical protein